MAKFIAVLALILFVSFGTTVSPAEFYCDGIVNPHYKYHTDTACHCNVSPDIPPNIDGALEIFLCAPQASCLANEIGYYDVASGSDKCLCEYYGCSTSRPTDLNDYIKTFSAFSETGLSGLQQVGIMLRKVSDMKFVSPLSSDTNNGLKKINQLVSESLTSIVDTKRNALAVISSIDSIRKIFALADGVVAFNSAAAAKLLEKAFATINEKVVSGSFLFPFEKHIGVAALNFLESFATADSVADDSKLFLAALSPAVAKENADKKFTLGAELSVISFGSSETANCFPSLYLSENKLKGNQITQTYRGVTTDKDGKLTTCSFDFGSKIEDVDKRMTFISEKVSGDLQCETSAPLIHNFKCTSGSSNNFFSVNIVSSEPNIPISTVVFVACSIVLAVTFGLLVISLIFLALYFLKLQYSTFGLDEYGTATTNDYEIKVKAADSAAEEESTTPAGVPMVDLNAEVKVDKVADIGGLD